MPFVLVKPLGLSCLNFSNMNIVSPWAFSALNQSFFRVGLDEIILFRSGYKGSRANLGLAGSNWDRGGRQICLQL